MKAPICCFSRFISISTSLPGLQFHSSKSSPCSALISKSYSLVSCGYRRGFISMASKSKKSLDKDGDDGKTSAARYTTRGNLLNEHQKEVDEARKNFLEMEIEKKRKMYKCKDRFTTLDDVPTWPEYFENNLKDDDTMHSWFKRNAKKIEKEVRGDLNKKMSIFRGDITTLEIDAIANAANESLLGGGGVDGAIHSAAGPRLRSECELLNGCSPGDAKISCGYKLPAKHVIHTVGPRGEKPEVLENCYKRSLKLLKSNNLKSLAFPCISTGIFGYPNLNAAKVALSTIRAFLEEDDYGAEVERIILCLFMKEDVQIYHEQMQLFFPIARAMNKSDNKKSEESPEEEATVEKPKETGTEQKRPEETETEQKKTEESETEQKKPEESETEQKKPDPAKKE